MGSWILYYLLPTDAKSLLFCMKQNCLGLQYRDLSSRAQHFVMKPCLCVNLSGICPFLLVTNFQIGNFFLRNENYCIPRCFISFLMQSRHLLSFLIVEPTLIWSESISWKIIEESYFLLDIISTLILSEQGRGEM